MESKETLEKTKEILEEAIRDVKKEQKWIILEIHFVQQIGHAARLAESQRTKGGVDIKQTRKFERKASRSEQRIHQFDQRLIRILESLRQRFPHWNHALYEIEEKLKIYEGNILKRVSFIGGTIIGLLKRNDVSQVVVEADKVLEEGALPLHLVLKHLESELRKNLYKDILAEKIQKEELDEHTEAWLNRYPFIIIFHSANERAFAHSILTMRHGLPQSYMGRRLEYAMEVDYFWIESDMIDAKTGKKVIDPITRKPIKKFHTFFGHALAHKIPNNAKILLEMYRGKTDPTQMKHRMGLMDPEWLLSRIGRIRLAIEIKGGAGQFKRGLDEKALNYLVKLLKSYHLENDIIFFGFSAWPLEYLKNRLPNSFVIHTSFGSKPIVGRNLPVNKLIRSLKYLISSYSFVDAFAETTKETEEEELIMIGKVTKQKKFLISWTVNKQEQLDRLIRHGARGATINRWPEEIDEWLKHPPTIGNQ